MKRTKAPVLMVSYQYAPAVDGGAERQAQYLAEGLAAREWPVSVVTAAYPGVPARETRGGVEVHRVWAVHQPKRLTLTFLPSLTRFLVGRGRQFDLWHVHQAYFHAGIAASLARLLRKRCLVKVAASGDYGDLARLRQGLWGTWVIRTLPWASSMVSLNEASSDELTTARLPRSRIRMIPNAVDSERLTPPSPRERVEARAIWGLPEQVRAALFAGRLAEEKGVSYLLDAWRIVEHRRSGAPWHLLVAGGGELSEHYRRRAERELKNVRFLGKVSDIRPALHAADLLVHPSLAEGMSNIVLEAMAAGLPVVGSRIPGIAELVDEGRTGMLVSPRDAESLANALIHLLRAPELALNMGMRARKLAVERYALPAMLDAYEELYYSLLR